MSKTHDIIIVGGGMVGLTLALALARQTSLSIALLESRSQEEVWSPSHYHHRVSAIALSSQRIFEALDVWNAMQQKRTSPFTNIEVWEEGSQHDIHFSCEEIAETKLGAIVENNVIQSVLQEKIKQYPSIEYISPVSLIEMIENESYIQLNRHQGNSLKASLVIAADGAQSWIRQNANIALLRHDYDQEAIVANVHTTLPHEHTARQVFLKTGPLAFLPLALPTLSSIVWSLPTHEAARLKSADLNDFKQALTQAFASRLGEVHDVFARYSFPLSKQEVRQYVKPRIALVGDAAHTIHPLAGQGVNIGLLDVAALVEVIHDAVKKRIDFSHLSTLRRYERWRRADNLAMLSGVHFIKNIFASDKKSIQQLRSFGLTFTNKMPWMKNMFIRHAVGDRKGLPKMALKS